MSDEIEAKFLLREDGSDYAEPPFFEIYNSIPNMVIDVLERGEKIKQGYLSKDVGLRIADKVGFEVDFEIDEARLRKKGKNYFFTLKSSGAERRMELEREIEKRLFNEYWPLTIGKRIEKKRLSMPYREFEVEFDVYTNRKLRVCEVEVATLEDLKRVPAFGLDISKDSNYKNKNLAF